LVDASPKARPMTPAVILRELGRVQVGDILLETTAGQQLAASPDRMLSKPRSWSP
jgi:hypothetical protein